MCGCTNIITEILGCNITHKICKGKHIEIPIEELCAQNLTITIIENPLQGEVIVQPNNIIYNHTSNTLETDSFKYEIKCGNNVLKRCLVTIEVQETIEEDKTVIELTANTEYCKPVLLNGEPQYNEQGELIKECFEGCEVGEPTYEWILPECATIVEGYSIYNQTIQVIVPVYNEITNPTPTTCLIQVKTCCLPCIENCCTTQNFYWNPPHYTNECQLTCTPYECTTYNPLTGNCEAQCEECEHCCNGVCSECCEDSNCYVEGCNNQPICQQGDCYCVDSNGNQIPHIEGQCCPDCTEDTLLPNCYECQQGVIVSPIVCSENETLNEDCECECSIGYCLNVLTGECVECPCSNFDGLYRIQTLDGYEMYDPFNECSVCSDCVDIGNGVTECITPEPQEGFIINPTPTEGVHNNGQPCTEEHPCCYIEDPCYNVECENYRVYETCTRYLPKFEGCSGDNLRFSIYKLGNNLTETQLQGLEEAGCDYKLLEPYFTEVVSNNNEGLTVSYNNNNSTTFEELLFGVPYYQIPKDTGVLIKIEFEGFSWMYEFVFNLDTCELAQEDFNLVTENPRLFRKSCALHYIIPLNQGCEFNSVTINEVGLENSVSLPIKQSTQGLNYFISIKPLGTIETEEIELVFENIVNGEICYSHEQTLPIYACTGDCGCDPCGDGGDFLKTNIETAINNQGNFIGHATVYSQCGEEITPLLLTCVPAEIPDLPSPLEVSFFECPNCITTDTSCGWVIQEDSFNIISYNGANIELETLKDGFVCFTAPTECGYSCECIQVEKQPNCSDFNISFEIRESDCAAGYFTVQIESNYLNVGSLTQAQIENALQINSNCGVVNWFVFSQSESNNTLVLAVQYSCPELNPINWEFTWTESIGELECTKTKILTTNCPKSSDCELTLSGLTINSNNPSEDRYIFDDNCNCIQLNSATVGYSVYSDCNDISCNNEPPNTTDCEYDDSTNLTCAYFTRNGNNSYAMVDVLKAAINKAYSTNTAQIVNLTYSFIAFGGQYPINGQGWRSAKGWNNIQDSLNTKAELKFEVHKSFLEWKNLFECMYPLVTVNFSPADGSIPNNTDIFWGEEQTTPTTGQLNTGFNKTLHPTVGDFRIAINNRFVPYWGVTNLADKYKDFSENNNVWSYDEVNAFYTVELITDAPYSVNQTSNIPGRSILDVMVHELGHIFGLIHSQGAGSPNSCGSSCVDIGGCPDNQCCSPNEEVMCGCGSSDCHAWYGWEESPYSVKCIKNLYAPDTILDNQTNSLRIVGGVLCN